MASFSIIFASSPALSWGKWVFLTMALDAFYCMFNARHRNVMLGEIYKLRFMKRTGAPASTRTAFLACVLWGSGFASFFRPRFWDWDYSGVLALGLFATVMLSSYLDARAFRDRSWR
jgi:hypothetical protein